MIVPAWAVVIAAVIIAVAVVAFGIGLCVLAARADRRMAQWRR